MRQLPKTRKNKKSQRGVVVSTGMEKTATVLVERTTKHPLYKKTIKLSKKFLFHDPEDICNVGDFVRIVECKPIYKNSIFFFSILRILPVLPLSFPAIT